MAPQTTNDPNTCNDTSIITFTVQTNVGAPPISYVIFQLNDRDDYIQDLTAGNPGISFDHYVALDPITGARGIRWNNTNSQVPNLVTFSFILAGTYYNVYTVYVVAGQHYARYTDGLPPEFTVPIPSYDPLSDIVSRLQVSGQTMDGNCGTAATIESDTQRLLLGCMVCPAPITSSTYTAGSLFHGAVSGKMKCNPKGAFSYKQKVANRCDNSVNQRFKNFDIALYSEFDCCTLLSRYLQSVDTVNTYGAILNVLASNGLNARVINLLTPLFQSLGVAVDNTNPDCPVIDTAKLKLSLLNRLRMNHKLQMHVNGNARNAKKADGRVDHGVRISWDFCSVPGAVQNIINRS